MNLCSLLNEHSHELLVSKVSKIVAPHQFALSLVEHHSGHALSLVKPVSEGVGLISAPLVARDDAFDAWVDTGVNHLLDGGLGLDAVRAPALSSLLVDAASEDGQEFSALRDVGLEGLVELGHIGERFAHFFTLKV